MMAAAAWTGALTRRSLRSQVSRHQERSALTRDKSEQSVAGRQVEVVFTMSPLR